MSILIGDQSIAASLAEATGPQELRGPDGRLLGHFTPAAAPKMSFPELAITDEEIERILNDPNGKWVGSDEVLARLREIDRCSP